MGVDWVPARPRPGVDASELRELIAAQADRVRSFLDYLLRLAAQECAEMLESAQDHLLDAVRRTTTRTNAWTRTARFRDACAQALALPPVPPADPAGEPPASATDDSPTPHQDRQFRDLSGHLDVAIEATRVFNRAVPAPVKVPYPEPMPATSRDPWLEEFFAWATPLLHDGDGLYLWP